MLGGEEHSIGDAAFYPEIDFDYFSADIWFLLIQIASKKKYAMIDHFKSHFPR